MTGTIRGAGDESVSDSSPRSIAGREHLVRVTVELIADGVHGNIDLLEIVCLWSNSVGSAELWYRLLNAGFPVAPSGGTDVMADFHRTMAVGATRVYVRPDGPFNWPNYFAALNSAVHTRSTTGKSPDRAVNATIAAGRPS